MRNQGALGCLSTGRPNKLRSPSAGNVANIKPATINITAEVFTRYTPKLFKTELIAICNKPFGNIPKINNAKAFTVKTPFCTAEK